MPASGLLGLLGATKLLSAPDLGAPLGWAEDAVKAVVGPVVGGISGGILGTIADAITEAVGNMVAQLGTLWIKVPTPSLTSVSGNGDEVGVSPSPVVAFIQGQLWWLMAFAAVCAVMIGGVRMVIEQRSQPGRDLVRGLLTFVVVSGTGLTVLALCTAASDQFAAGVIDASLEDGDFGQAVGRMLGFAAASSGGSLGVILVILLGIIALFVSLAQIVLMVLRAGMLVVMAGALPLSASFTNTEAGRAWFRRFVAWTVAFLLYKPTAAIIYATAIKLPTSGGLLQVITGLGLMLMSVIALPALMKFLTPMTSAIASGGGGGLAGGAALAASLPTGAVALGSPRMAGFGGGGPMAGPAGAAGAMPLGSGGSGRPGGQGGSGPAGGEGAPGLGTRGAIGPTGATGAAATAAGGTVAQGAVAAAGEGMRRVREAPRTDDQDRKDGPSGA
jgi:hypothetical protein